MNLSLIMEEAARFAVVEATEIQKLLEDNHAVSIQGKCNKPGYYFYNCQVTINQ